MSKYHALALTIERTYGVDRLVSETVLRGHFKHNTGRFTVAIMVDGEGLEKWNHRGAMWDQGERGALSSLPTVISAQRVPGDNPEVIEVAVGDVLVTAFGSFEIRDDVALHNPRLVEVESDL